jgi:catechol 2,3-dioxygenase-like lactoylglutathione lyase family enzyme
MDKDISNSLSGAGPGEDVTWNHTSVTVDDLDAAARFFRECFGYETKLDWRGITDLADSVLGTEGTSADVVQLRWPETRHILELSQYTIVDEPPGDHGPTKPGEGHIGFRTPDFDGLLEKVQTLGASMIGQVTDFGDRRAVYLRVPGGPVIEIEERPQRRDRP